VDIVVKGSNVEVPDHFRQHIAEKLQKIERYDSKIIRVDVELSHECNPRQSERCQRVELTCSTRGPVVRAEARASDFYTALDFATTKLDARLRRASDRRRMHRGRRKPVSLAEATALANRVFDPFLPPSVQATVDTQAEPEADRDEAPWHLAREKEHKAEPMTVDEALYQMELVGHDFYLFLDKDSGRSSVVYRRRAYDYGLISLVA
jgi:ribosomal subunit interface protein